jgi:pimeloyl-ACP methyl ester carboxylesterase
MIPMFFGETARPLFGVYHSPEGTGSDHAVVISYPVGHEYARVHRVGRYLAVLLSRGGYPTLRFDYTGTGDSFGEAEDGDLNTWRRDLTLAVEEVRDTSGCRRVSLVGIRLGGTIAATVPRYPCPVETIYLWDPVVSGPDYLEELRGQHRAWLGEPSLNGGPGQLLGTAFSEKLLEELGSLDLRNMEFDLDGSVVVALSKPLSPVDALLARLNQSGVPAESFMATDQYDWQDPRGVETIITAPNMLRELLGRIGGA